MTEAKPETIETRSPSETVAFGRRLADRLERGDCVALIGPLGAGKTVLVRGIAEGLGLADSRLVSSPTFVLVQEYPARMPLFHIDLYRTVQADEELEGLGLGEMLADGVVVIEWAERAGSALPRPYWQVELVPTGRTRRRFTVQRRD